MPPAVDISWVDAYITSGALSMHCQRVAVSLLHLSDRSIVDLQYNNAPACNLNWHVSAGLRRW